MVMFSCRSFIAPMIILVVLLVLILWVSSTVGLEMMWVTVVSWCLWGLKVIVRFGSCMCVLL